MWVEMIFHPPMIRVFIGPGPMTCHTSIGLPLGLHILLLTLQSSIVRAFLFLLHQLMSTTLLDQWGRILKSISITILLGFSQLIPDSPTLLRASTSSFFKLFYFTISKTTLSIIPYHFPIHSTYPKLYSFTILFKYYFLVFLYYLFPIVIFVRVIFCRIWLILWQNALYL